MRKLPDYIKDDTKELFRNKKNLINLLLLGILVLAIPLGVNLIKRQQIFRSRAVANPIVFTGPNVSQRSDGSWVAFKPQISLSLTSPLGPQTGSTTSPSPDPTSSSTPVPTSSAAFQVGVNLETAPSYGYNDLRPYSKSTDIDADLRELQKMGGTLVRVIVANNQISDSEAARRLGVFLDAASQHSISAIPVFIDLYASGHNPQGTDQYYTTQGGFTILNNDFFVQGYKANFKSFVTTVINANKNRTNIYGWEVGNELKDDVSPQVLIDFMKDMTSLMKSLDSTHKIALGMLNSAHSDLSADALYSNVPNADIVTVHLYNNNRSGAGDVTWAVNNGKIALIEEIGMSGSGDRSASLRNEINYWKNLGVSGILHWGFIAKGLNDNGDGDRIYGFDALFHNDYDQVFSVMQSF